MGKKDKKKTVEPKPLSKKERKALEAREAQLRAELAEREKAAAKKKSKGKKKVKAEKPDTAALMLAEKAERKARISAPPAQILDAKAEREARREAKRAQRFAEESDPLSAPHYAAGPVPEAEVEAGKANADAQNADIDAQIKARLQHKRAERAGLDPDSVDRADADAVRAYNLEAVKHGLTLLTSDAEREKYASRGKKGKREASPKDDAEAALIAAGKAAIDGDLRGAVDEIKHAVEIVETEHGREFAVGESVAADVPDFAQPSEAPKTFEENVNGLGQYKVARPSDGKIVGYTRWTTYIDCLEDKTALEKWKARILLEGVAAAEEMGDAVTAKVRDLAHRRDVAIAKARKADRKGKLGVGELATYVNGAWSDFKKALDRLADEVFEVGGGREKATKGTDIHALCDLAEREGIAAVGDLLTAGEITPSDLADVEAYLDAIRRLGAKPILAEQVVVNDDLKVAGRLDRVYMVKLPGETRGRRRVVDLKTGRVDYGTGKIAMQIEGYAGSVAYDPDTNERTPLGVDRTLGLLIHLPAGSGKATVHRVDLSLGRKGNKLAGDVRAWRNEGKRAIDLKVDVLDEINAATEAEASDA